MMRGFSWAAALTSGLGVLLALVVWEYVRPMLSE